jgi:hypothetical protein
MCSQGLSGAGCHLAVERQLTDTPPTAPYRTGAQRAMV